MTILRCLACALLLAAVCPAQLPDYYKTVNRVTWVVENIDRVRAAWEAMGLSGIREYPNIELVGRYRGKPVTIYAWQITGRIGNLTVEMIQPAEGQANAYTDFLSKHGDGILSIVHEVPSREALEQEIRRMKAKGADVLQQVTVQQEHRPVTYTYFDTEPAGKFVLGLVSGAAALRRPADGEARATVSHFGWVVRDAPSKELASATEPDRATESSFWSIGGPSGPAQASKELASATEPDRATESSFWSIGGPSGPAQASVSAYWQRLGLPPFPMQHATPRADGRYRGNPLSLAFEVGFQRHAQFRYEWVSPPPNPPNIYADFLNKHNAEGIQHIGMLVDDLPKSIAAFEKLGYQVHQAGAWGDVGKPGSGQYAYMDTASFGGVSLELIRSY